ncbi:MAG: TadE/TadG family type IV pilus assembly protein [Rhodospirillaceae bacterium]
MKRALKRQRGVAAVEMGIVLIPLVTLVFGITELGRAFYQYNSLAKATRDAARYLSAQGPGDADDIAVAKCMVVYGNSTCSGSALVPGLTVSQVSVCDASNCASTHGAQTTGSGVVNLVTVSVVGYSFTSIVPFVVPNLTFNDIGTTMRQVL